jgi:hypothetical protein
MKPPIENRQAMGRTVYGHLVRVQCPRSGEEVYG